MVDSQRIENAVEHLRDYGYPVARENRGFIKIDPGGDGHITINESDITDVETPDEKYVDWVSFRLAGTINQFGDRLGIDKEFEGPLGDTLRPLKRMRQSVAVRVLFKDDGVVQIEQGDTLEARLDAFNL